METRLDILNLLLNWSAAGFLINGIWFVHNVVYTRFVRQHVRKLQANVFECEAATHAYLLEHHFRKLRNEEGVMLMKSASVLLQEKKPRRTSPKSPQ